MYLKGTLDYGIKYTDAFDVELTGYSDSDWARNLDDRRSTTGYAFGIGSGVVSWSSKKNLLYLCLLLKHNIKPCVQQLVKLFG